MICEHDIGNIFCACQDGDNMNYFAYITREMDTERNYCHVFCVSSTVSTVVVCMCVCVCVCVWQAQLVQCVCEYMCVASMVNTVCIYG